MVFSEVDECKNVGVPWLGRYSERSGLLIATLGELDEKPQVRWILKGPTLMRI